MGADPRAPVTQVFGPRTDALAIAEEKGNAEILALLRNHQPRR